MTSPNRENPFSHLKVRYLVLWSVVIFLILSVSLGVIGGIGQLNLQDPILQPIFYIAFFVLLCGWIWRKLKAQQVDVSHLIGPLPHPFRWQLIVLLVMAIVIFSLGTGILLFYALSFVSPSLVESLLQDKTLLSPDETATPILHNALNIFAMVVVAPLTEEFIFRGVILHRWATKWSVGTALLVSSLIFGLLHANIVGLSIFGLIMGLLYLQSRTLWIPILAHALNNAAALGLTLLSRGADSPSAETTLEQIRSGWGIGVFLILISVPWLVWFISKNWPSQPTQMPYFAHLGEPERRVPRV